MKVTNRARAVRRLVAFAGLFALAAPGCSGFKSCLDVDDTGSKGCQPIEEPGSCPGILGFKEVCVPPEICEPTLLGSTCMEVDFCETHADCGDCEKCLPRTDGRRSCVETYGCVQSSTGAGLSGTCVPGKAELLASGIGAARQLAQDDTHLYWVDGGFVRSVPKSGGPVAEIASGAFDGAIHQSGPDLYLGAQDAIWRLPPADSKAEPRKPQLWTSFLGSTWMITSNADELVWTRTSPDDDVQGALFQSPANVVVHGTSMFPDGQHPVAVDETHVYWGDGATVRAVDASSTEALLHPGEVGAVSVLDLASDGAAVYFVANGIVWRATFEDGATALTASESDASFVAVDDEALYWTISLTDGVALRRTDKQTLATQTLLTAAGPSVAPPLLVDGGCVYWLAGDSVFRTANTLR